MRILKVDGSSKDIAENPSLKELQEAVGGYIELVGIPGRNDDYVAMYVNEDGLRQELELNQMASLYARRDIVGDVVLMNEREYRIASGDDVA